MDKITLEEFQKRAPHSPDILEIFTSHRRSDKKMNRLYGVGSSMQEINEVRNNTNRTQTSTSINTTHAVDNNTSGSSSNNLSNSNSNSNSSNNVLRSKSSSNASESELPSSLPPAHQHPKARGQSMSLGREESVDSSRSSSGGGGGRPSSSECGSSVCDEDDDTNDLVSNHELFFKLTGVGDIVTMSAMLAEDVQYDSFTRNETIVGRANAINVFSIVRITSGARKMVGSVSRFGSVRFGSVRFGSVP